MRNQNLKLAIVGASGLVGREMLKVLEERNLPLSRPRLFASERSLGQKLSFRDEELEVELLGPEVFETESFDFVLFACSAGIAAEYAPQAAASGALVIDNSSHFRMQPQVPLIVPEINPDSLEMAREGGIISNPNCSTIQMLCVLKPLDDAFGLQRVVVSTYQSVSGAGQEAMDEMQTQVGQLLAGQPPLIKEFSKQIAFNCIPQIDLFLEDGSTREELKMVEESRKILGRPDLRMVATAVRVPTFISHAESLNLEFARPVSVEEARELLRKAPGLEVWDDPNERHYPTPFDVAGRDEVFVGRIRLDPSVENGLAIWAVADNLRKGAATNAIQILELCLRQSFCSRRKGELAKRA
ncbi:MAG: aspartate-semialdehyde dehydrogenase [Bradymonadales bacterium]|nr:MAG: aspartate-semialdehyde dehydrogenase [Bradymonadales bacterium]